MKCKNCKKERGFNVFNATDDKAVEDVGYLYGICFYCFDKVPNYIPNVQVKRWLQNEMQKLQRREVPEHI